MSHEVCKIIFSFKVGNQSKIDLLPNSVIPAKAGIIPVTLAQAGVTVTQQVS